MLLLQYETANVNLVLRSVDAGETWSSGAPLSVTLPSFLSGIKPTCGHGIVTRKNLCQDGCTTAGRLVVRPMEIAALRALAA